MHACNEEARPPCISVRVSGALWCACADALHVVVRNGSGSQLKVKVFGWWKTFGALKQESAADSSAQVGNRKRRSFEGLVLTHSLEERQLRSLRVLTGLLAYRCFTTASFETEFETDPTASTSLGEKRQLGLKCRSQTPTTYQCYVKRMTLCWPTSVAADFQDPICSHKNDANSCAVSCVLSGRSRGSVRRRRWDEFEQLSAREKLWTATMDEWTRGFQLRPLPRGLRGEGTHTDMN